VLYCRQLHRAASAALAGFWAWWPDLKNVVAGLDLRLRHHVRGSVLAAGNVGHQDRWSLLN
jgi:hypothetical protein